MVAPFYQGLVWTGIALFIGGLIWTYYLLGSNSGTDDKAEDVKKALGQVALINSVLIGILAGMSFLYIGADPSFERPYILIMLHASVFFSLTGASISAIQQLSTASNSSQNAQPSNCKS